MPKGAAQSLEAPYFVDLVNDTLQSKFQDADFQANAFRIYTTLDMRLQRAAAEAIRAGHGERRSSRSASRGGSKAQTLPEAAGGAGGHRPAYRRGEGAGRADATTG